MHQRRHHHAEHSAGQQAGGQQQRQRALAALPQHQPHQPGPEQPEQQALHQRIGAEAGQDRRRQCDAHAPQQPMQQRGRLRTRQPLAVEKAQRRLDCGGIARIDVAHHLIVPDARPETQTATRRWPSRQHPK
ncbi:hypothetical protein G6F57_012890 [Rhizopus arrhizus]|nr:hypothetical protein G6F57_012890 [Rhizopus arrhizus]